MKGRNPLESRARDVGGIWSCGDSPVRGAFSFGRTASRRANQSYSVFWKTRAGAKIRGIIINRTDHSSIENQTCKTHSTTWSMILRANFPTLVPPNFCTTQLLLVLTGPPLTIDTGSESEGSRLSMLVNWTITGLWACNSGAILFLCAPAGLRKRRIPGDKFFDFFSFCGRRPRDIGAIMILDNYYYYYCHSREWPFWTSKHACIDYI